MVVLCVNNTLYKLLSGDEMMTFCPRGRVLALVVASIQANMPRHHYAARATDTQGIVCIM